MEVEWVEPGDGEGWLDKSGSDGGCIGRWREEAAEGAALFV